MRLEKQQKSYTNNEGKRKVFSHVIKICKGDKSQHLVCVLHQARPVWLIVFFECADSSSRLLGLKKKKAR